MAKYSILVSAALLLYMPKFSLNETNSFLLAVILTSRFFFRKFKICIAIADKRVLHEFLRYF